VNVHIKPLMAALAFAATADTLLAGIAICPQEPITPVKARDCHRSTVKQRSFHDNPECY
jgi:hypothetical protein